MKILSIKTLAAIALLGANDVAFAGFLKGSAEVQSDTDESEGCRPADGDPCLKANGMPKCNSNSPTPVCVIEVENNCDVSCVAATTTAATEAATAPSIPTCEMACEKGTLNPDRCVCEATDETTQATQAAVKVQSDTDESDDCFAPPCLNVHCNGSKVCRQKCDGSCDHECVTLNRPPCATTTAATKSVLVAKAVESDMLLMQE